MKEPGQKITQAELAERFPNGEIPMWAVEILFGSPGDWTVGQVRDALEAEFQRRKGDSVKEPGQLAFETHEKFRDWNDREPWRSLHPADKAEWAAVEAAIRADEREACAKVAEASRFELARDLQMVTHNYACNEIAAAIRGRK